MQYFSEKTDVTVKVVFPLLLEAMSSVFDFFLTLCIKLLLVKFIVTVISIYRLPHSDLLYMHITLVTF